MLVELVFPVVADESVEILDVIREVDIQNYLNDAYG